MTRNELLDAARRDLDWAAFDQLAKKLPKDSVTFSTYLDAEMWLAKLWKEAVARGLNTPTPRRVLDLGTGPGYFVYVCQRLGHEALGLERPETVRDLFHAWLGVPVIGHTIAAKQPLPRLLSRYDLVTSFRVPFNVKRGSGEQGRRQLFDLEDWAFFLDDIRDNALTPGGTFVMKMNAQSAHDGPRYGDPELMDFFAQRGGLADSTKYVVFAPLI